MNISTSDRYIDAYIAAFKRLVAEGVPAKEAAGIATTAAYLEVGLIKPETDE